MNVSVMTKTGALHRWPGVDDAEEGDDTGWLASTYRINENDSLDVLNEDEEMLVTYAPGTWVYAASGIETK